ncbi:Dyp-type peroxidase [Kribbella solani]|uniref:Dyp-type peroxidase n=1 Tax=Kribbella solani TaxID=236067 RepID=UPI0029B19707|nr:Dyp-type peroxidase [Kribbella solani]MDX3002692.1 Dyp-type peroxidase [Kribbella solani]
MLADRTPSAQKLRADRPSRRTLLGAATAAVLTAGCDTTTDQPQSAQSESSAQSQSSARSESSGQSQSSAQSQSPTEPTSAPPAVPPTGKYQAGITTPRAPQPNLLAVVADVTPSTPIGPLLAGLGDTIRALTAGTAPRLAGLAPGDLTVTVGIGPRLVRTSGTALPGATDLPRFANERIDPTARGGDVLLQICATDALLLSVVAAALLDHPGLKERWRQSARRGPSVPVAENLTAPRNQLGFVDGIIGPHTESEQDRNLWLAGPKQVAGGTIAVVRRMELDLRRFTTLSKADQEAVMGRHRDTGAPLSGGKIADGPDLGAKTPDGRYLVPAGAHARRAHATAIGVGLMLRRSYSIDDPAPGLLFISFQNELRTFTATLTHMENGDALLPFTRTTAGGTFLILPGFDDQHPLGSTLF